jgi:hypothetical protein
MASWLTTIIILFVFFVKESIFHKIKPLTFKEKEWREIPPSCTLGKSFKTP